VTGPTFCGVKMLPPGVHFVAYAATGGPAAGGGGGGGGGAPGAWFWIDAAPASVTVRRWCPAHELLLPLDDEDEVDRYAAGVRRFDFDGGLAPYDLASAPVWRALTRHVSSATLARISPGPAPNASVTAEADPGGGRPPTAHSARCAPTTAGGRAALTGGRTGWRRTRGPCDCRQTLGAQRGAPSEG
jgi:A1 cistron-splicing factor AAR2